MVSPDSFQIKDAEGKLVFRMIHPDGSFGMWLPLAGSLLEGTTFYFEPFDPCAGKVEVV